jgi:predicted transposase/invertase (TIGR01784 family)
VGKKKEIMVPTRKILPPKSDVVFKMLFGDERNKDILIDFLKSILSLSEDEYEHITIADPHLKRERKKDKLGIVDVKLTSKSGKIIHIEIQVLEQDEIPERVTYYNAKMLAAQLKSGEEFDTLQKTISILITDFEIIEDRQKYHYTFELIDKTTGAKFTDLIEIHTLELQKTPKETDNTTKYDWLRFLKAESEEEFNMIADRSPAIHKAVVEIKRLSQSERAQLIYEDREKAIHDHNSRLKSALKKGRAEAEKEAHMDKIELAKKLKKRGIPTEYILEDTGLSIEEIEE